MKPPVSSDCCVSTNLSPIGNDEAALDDDDYDDDDDDDDDEGDDVILTQEDERSQGLFCPVQFSYQCNAMQSSPM